MGPAPSRDEEFRTTLPSQSVSSVANTEPTMIEWRHGGKEVYVTGTFNGWRAKVPMKEYEPGIWRVNIYAPPGRVEYKFIVDGYWKYSADHPRLQDQIGNTNNYINVLPSSVKDSDASSISPYVTNMPDLSELRNHQPGMIPSALNNSPLNYPGETNCESRATLLSIPDHTILGHMFSSEMSANIDILSVSSRYDTKYVTSVIYVPTGVHELPCLDNADVLIKDIDAFTQTLRRRMS